MQWLASGFHGVSSLLCFMVVWAVAASFLRSGGVSLEHRVLLSSMAMLTIVLCLGGEGSPRWI
jgi:cytosine/uracil/thiamine/allantoin permease